MTFKYAIRHTTTNETMERCETYEEAKAICQEYNELGQEDTYYNEYKGTYKIVEI